MEVRKLCETCTHYARSPQIGWGACMHGPLQAVVLPQGLMSIHPPVQAGQFCNRWQLAEGQAEGQAAGQGAGQENGRILQG